MPLTPKQISEASLKEILNNNQEFDSKELSGKLSDLSIKISEFANSDILPKFVKDFISTADLNHPYVLRFITDDLCKNISDYIHFINEAETKQAYVVNESLKKTFGAFLSSSLPRDFGNVENLGFYSLIEDVAKREKARKSEKSDVVSIRNFTTKQHFPTFDSSFASFELWLRNNKSHAGLLDSAKKRVEVYQEILCENLKAEASRFLLSVERFNSKQHFGFHCLPSSLASIKLAALHRAKVVSANNENPYGASFGAKVVNTDELKGSRKKSKHAPDNRKKQEIHSICWNNNIFSRYSWLAEILKSNFGTQIPYCAKIYSLSDFDDIIPGQLKDAVYGLDNAVKENLSKPIFDSFLIVVPSVIFQSHDYSFIKTVSGEKKTIPGGSREDFLKEVDRELVKSGLVLPVILGKALRDTYFISTVSVK